MAFDRSGLCGDVFQLGRMWAHGLNMRLLIALLMLTSAFAFLTPTANAACIDANPTDDNGVGFSCTVPVFNETCSARAGEYGDPNPLPSASCNVIPIECVTEPCP